MRASVLRFRKLCYVEPVRCHSLGLDSFETPKTTNEVEGIVSAGAVSEAVSEKKKQRKPKKWNCVDWCCWMIGYMFTTWWLLLFLYHSLPSTLTGFQVPESPGARLKREGLTALHPVVLVPGIVTGGLELWEGRPCAEGLFRKRLWGGSFTEIFKRPLCWLEHLSLDNETGLDPSGIRVRAVPGLVAADYFAPGYFVWAILIENLARIGYEGKNLHMAAYDWRLSFQNTEVRDQALSRLKSKIELMFVSNGYKKVVVVPHSMGVLYFLHFLKWVEAPTPEGGGGGPRWCAKHIKAVMNIGPVFLGVPKAVSNIFSAEAKDIAFARAMAPVVLDSNLLGLQTLEHIMRVSRTWDSIMSLLPKGGEAIWGSLDWSPEEGCDCDPALKNYLQASLSRRSHETNTTGGKLGCRVEEPAKYGRIISFGKAASRLPSSKLQSFDLKSFMVLSPRCPGEQLLAWTRCLAIYTARTTIYNYLLDHVPKAVGKRLGRLIIHEQDLSRGGNDLKLNSSCEEIWTEYDEMSRESIRKVAENKAYTATTILDLLRFVAPKMMQRADAHFSHGIAENLDDPKYSHYKYWSNPLETKLPEAPDMEIYSLYGVGIPTERSYVYKLSPSERCKSIPFRIDSSADENNGGCLRNGVHFVDGDESVPVLSAGFMCARGWRGRSRFNPSGISTYIREFRHKPPANLLEGRGLESGAHVDIMGNVALIEDVMRVAAGASGVELGGDQIYSDIMRISERISLRL